MNLKKLFSAVSACAIAVTSTIPAVPAAAAERTVVKGNAGISFQTNTTWNYRNPFGIDYTDAAFPETKVGVEGGAYGIDENLVCQDTAINGDGTYTVSINTSGTISSANPTLEGTDPKTNYFYLDAEDPSLTRQGSSWSMLKNSEPVEFDEGITQDQLEWQDGQYTDRFNMLLITTDIPCEFYRGKPEVNGYPVDVTDITVDMCGTVYKATGDTYYYTDMDYLNIALINNYADSTITPDALPEKDGTITVTFKIKGLGIAKHTHTCGHGTVAEKKATCTSPGSRTYTCAICGETIVETIPKIAHKYTTKVVKPTYTAKGYTQHTCSVCGYSYKDKYTDMLKRTSIAKATVTVSSKKTYTGKALKPSVTVKVGKTKLKSGTDYSVSYKNNTKTGKATVTITGKGKYTGKKSANFIIVPKKPGTPTVKALGGKKIKVTVKKDKMATGYQIQVSTSKKFTKKTTKTSTLTKTAKTFTKLKKGTKYYVRTRSYKTVGKTKYYGSYSNIKSVKCK